MTSPTSHAPRAAALDVARQIAGRVLNLALGVVVTALVVRALGEEGFGRWATVFVVVQVVEYFTNFGLEQVAVRFAGAEADEDKREQWVDGLVSLRMALALPAFAAAVLIVLLIEPDAEMRAAGVILASTILLGGPSMVRVRFQLRLRNDVPVAVTTVNSVLWGIAVVALYLSDAGLVAFAVAFTVVGFLTTALQVGLSWRLAPLRLAAGRQVWRELIRVGVPVGIAGLLILAYARIDQVLVFELAGERDAGLYGAVYRVLEQAHLVPVALMATLAPMTAAAIADPERLRRIVGVAIRLLAITSLGGLALSIPLSEPVVTLLFGDDFADASHILPVLAAAFVAICFGYIAGNLVLLFDLQKRFVRIALAALVVNVALNVALIPHYGYKAAAWATLATELVVVVPTLTMALRRLGGGFPAAGLARAVLAAVLFGLALEGLELAGLPLGVLLVLALPLYVAALVTCGAVGRADLREIRAAR